MRFFPIVGAVIWIVARSEVAIAQTMGSDDLSDVASRADTFALNLYKNLARQEEKDFVHAPLSIWMMLAMVSYFARGETDQRRTNASTYLGVTSNDEAYIYSSAVFMRAQKCKDNGMHLSAKLFLHEGYGGKEDSIKLNERFASIAQSVDFRDLVQAVNEINGWSKNQTKNLVKNIVDTNTVSIFTKMAAASTAYFKGIWQYPFSDAFAYKDYPVGTLRFRVIQMHGCGRVKLGEIKELHAKFVEIPYKKTDNSSGSLSMIAVWPQRYYHQNDEFDRVSVNELEGNITKLTMDKFNGGEEKLVFTALPKFKIESTVSLKSILEKMNTDVSSGSNAHPFDFDDALPTKYLNYVQRAAIEVDEGNDGNTPVITECFSDDFVSVPVPFLGFIVYRDNYFSSPIKLLTFRYDGLQ